MLRYRNNELPNVHNSGFVEYFAIMQQIIFKSLFLFVFVLDDRDEHDNPETINISSKSLLKENLRLSTLDILINIKSNNNCNDGILFTPSTIVIPFLQLILLL